MHVVVYCTAGINFIGSSILLLLCLDWNSLVRSGVIFYNSSSENTCKLVRILAKLNFNDRVTFSNLKTVSENKSHSNHLTFEDENGTTHHDIYAFEQLCHRALCLYPIAAILKFPGIKFLTNKFLL